MTNKNDKYILSLVSKMTSSELRKEIQKVYKVKKSRGNEIFNRIINQESFDTFCKAIDRSYKDMSPTANKAASATAVEQKEKTITHSSKFNKLEDVLLELQVDTKKWNVLSYRVENKKEKDGSERFQFSISLKANLASSAAYELAALKQDMISYSPKAKALHKPNDEGKLLEILLFDAHVGKLSWRGETNQDYDISIARQCFFDALEELVSEALSKYPISRILFPIGNDYLHTDNDNSTTTSGTVVDSDSRFAKVFTEGRKILVEAIQYLSQFAPVDVITVRGNHDSVSMFHLGDSLECYFHNDKNVKIDNGAQTRKYYTYGQNLFLYTHGQNEKPEKLPLLAATEQPEAWFKSKWRSARLGHFHHEMVKSYNGFRVFYVPSISGVDKYHFDNGFTESMRCAQAFIHDKDFGLKTILYSNPVV